MAIIKAKIIDSRHLELSEDILSSSDEVYLKIVEKKTINSIRGGWGLDVDSAEFVENLRKSTPIEPL
ncbi:hypothetical protein ACKUB1_18165 [Methanospirillum stamsii]|uniref:Uncharacterized protein n=1 Tax=Methanospirillum stamsii TaxID=1277351 RepID=A0A2V2N6Z0_9EURY|nr:hypothetical protein [Methanospirillum stamsii]PWR75832.1 hypothetical protein DLD82_01830 [Methanospirillum stamsii]